MTPVHAHESFTPGTPGPSLGPAGSTPRAPRRHVPLQVTALALCAVLAGCAPAAGTDDPGDTAPRVASEVGTPATTGGEGTDAAPAGTPEQDTTAAAAPADAAPSDPAFTPDDASAVAVAEEFVRALDIALSTGDTEGLAAISAATCGSCADYVESARSGKAMHETVTGGALTVHGESEVTEREEAIGAVAVNVPFTQEAGERFARLGESIGTWDTKELRFHVELVASPTGWLVTGTDSFRIVESD